MTTETQTPIAALERAVEYVESAENRMHPYVQAGNTTVADARAALEDVEALVAAVRRRPCLGVARDGYEDECLTTDAPPGLWCWRCAALAKFPVKS